MDDGKEESKRDNLHTANDVSAYFQNKRMFYEAAIRNGFYLPKFKSSIITEEYITDVVNGRLYCPKFDDIRMKPCPRPPDKDELITLLKQNKSSTGN